MMRSVLGLGLFLLLLPAASSLGIHGVPTLREDAVAPSAREATLPAYPILPFGLHVDDGAPGHVARFPAGSVRFEATADQPDGYGIEFRCPRVEDELRAATGCPLYVLDLEDIMGSPLLVVDRQHPDLIAFHALHGGAGLRAPNDPAPSPRSRDDGVHQPHTIFVSTAGGSSWIDNRYYSPFRFEYPDVFGEDQTIVLDHERNLVVSALYATRGAGETQYTYRLILRKLDPISPEPISYSGSSTQRAFDMGDRIDGLGSVHVAATQKAVVLWRQQKAAAALPADGPGSFVDATWLETSGGWKRLDASQRVGPCRSISNPVAVEADVFFACLPDEGYAHGSTEVWHLHALDTRTMSSRHVGATTIEWGRQGNLQLATTHGKGLVLAAAGVDGAGNPYARVAFGTTDGDWSEPRDHFGAVTNLTREAQQQSGLSIAELRITALAWHPYTHYTHFIYMERYEADGPAAAGRVSQPQYFKRMAVLQPSGSIAGMADLRVGVLRTPFDPQYQGVGEAVFNDLHDDIEIVRTPSGQWREWIAYGDYGFVRFAEIDERNEVGAPPPLGGVQPPIPAPNPGLNPHLVAAGAGSLAAAAALRMLSAKKKTTAEAPA